MVVANKVKQNLLDFFAKYKEVLVDLHTKQWNEEDNFENSEYYLNIANYWALVLNSILLDSDVEQYDVDTLFSTYNVEVLKECAGCIGISYEDILSYFYDKPQELTLGIESIQIECTFEVEPETFDNTVSCLTCVSLIEACSTDFLEQLNESCILKFNNEPYECN